MDYYAFIPQENGRAPLGSANQTILRNFVMKRNAIKQAKIRLGNEKIVVMSFTNFYDDKTFRLVHNGTEFADSDITKHLDV